VRCLVRAARDRNEAGFGAVPEEDDAIFAALYPSLRRWAAVVGPVEEDPDDLVQEALVRVLSRGPLSDLDDAHAYLRTTIVRLAANSRRRLGRGRRAWSRLGASEATGDDRYPSDLDELRRLAPADRAVLYLSLVEGHTYREAAVILGCTEVAARARASRALRRLRTCVREEL
jgi:DNA-directed RNA polymerase specialized sigma24 family protein